MKNLLVLQSGGPTAVINSSLAGVIKGACDFLSKDSVIYGALNGIEGIEAEKLVNLDVFKDEKNLSLLKQTPASYLGTCRKKLPSVEESKDTYKKLFEVFEKNNIEYVCCIGGNDSMDTTDKLSTYAKEYGKSVRVIGVPKTIDNDLAMTDHTPGYGSAAKFIANSVRQVALDAAVYKLKSVIVLEAMGRNAGWLTAAASLANDGGDAGVDIVCLPEIAVEKDKLLQRIEEISKTKNAIIVAVSEGVKDKTGNYIKADSNNGGYDKFGHAILGGSGKTVENWIPKELGFKTRCIELSLLQRCFSQGASLCDVEEAFMAGYNGAKAAIEGKTGIMIGFKRVSENPYKMEITSFPVSEIANKEKIVPKSMISESGFEMTEEYKRYALPLIAGEPNLCYKNGLLQFAPKNF
ncbi:MAG: 6-phosphofructokinase [Clostridia bacterium]|nr:6-phosphofructokinase [Clostridia bacterium]